VGRVDVAFEPLHPVDHLHGLPGVGVRGGRTLNSRSGSSGGTSRGLRYAQMRPLRSRNLYAFSLTLSLKSLWAGSLGMSTQAPVTSYIQPW
jgi:hypothetical protein